MESFEQKFDTFSEILAKNTNVVTPVLKATLKAAMIEAHFNAMGGGNEVIRKKRVNGYNLFMKERMLQLKTSTPDMDSNHRMTQISEEWKKLTEPTKEEWKTKAKALPVEEVKISLRARVKKEKKPHQISGYQLYVREKMPEMKEKVPPKERMTQIGGLWKALPQDQKDIYKTRASALPPTGGAQAPVVTSPPS
jgi:hypothetical protein